MTFAELNAIIETNNIPRDVKLLSDSGWECDATDMGSIYYNKETNEIVFKQGGKYEANKYTNPEYSKFRYRPEKGWERLYIEM